MSIKDLINQNISFLNEITQEYNEVLSNDKGLSKKTNNIKHKIKNQKSIISKKNITKMSDKDDLFFRNECLQIYIELSAIVEKIFIDYPDFKSEE